MLQIESSNRAPLFRIPWEKSTATALGSRAEVCPSRRIRLRPGSTVQSLIRKPVAKEV